MGGEHVLKPEDLKTGTGSSPRGRGTHLFIFDFCLDIRIIPAWAGNTAARHRLAVGLPDHPRVGGEHVVLQWLKELGSGSSPRGRGTRLAVLITPEIARIIPAWAGNTKSMSSRCHPPTDHPRVGGEHSSCKPLI